MNKLLCMILFMGIYFCTTAADAQNSISQPDRGVGLLEFAESWHLADQEGTGASDCVKAAWYMGYVYGTITTKHVMQNQHDAQKMYKVNGNITLDQALQAIHRYLLENPDSLREESHLLVNKALLQAFPQ